MILLVPALISILVGYLRKGRLSGVLGMRLRGLWLILIAFALEASTGLLVRYFPAYFPEYIWAESLVQFGLLFAFVLLNDRQWPVAVMGLGILLNFLVIILNGGRMPVAQDVVNYPEFASLVERIQNGSIPEYFIMRGGEPLWFLGDVIFVPVRGVGYGSVGDFILAAGVVLLIQKGMILGRPRHVKGGRRHHGKETRAVAADGGGSGARTG